MFLLDLQSEILTVFIYLFIYLLIMLLAAVSLGRVFHTPKIPLKLYEYSRYNNSKICYFLLEVLVGLSILTSSFLLIAVILCESTVN